MRERVAYAHPVGERGRYFIYMMFKRKLSTHEAIRKLAILSDLPTSAFAFGGLKDKQGLSEQVISVDGRALKYREKNLKLTYVGRRDEPITSADVAGNRFVITARGLTHSLVERAHRSVALLQQTGMPNYFDSQRFGSVRHGQKLPAREMVRGNFEEACRLYMGTPSLNSKGAEVRAQRYISKKWGEWEELADKLRSSPYGRMLGHLADRPTDFCGAVGYMARARRAFHLFAYQSLLWNQSVCALFRKSMDKKQRFSVPYLCGHHVFPERLHRDWSYTTFPLLAPETVFADELVAEVCESVLAAERISLADLALPASCKGFFRTEERPLMVVPSNFSCTDDARDDLTKGKRKLELRFELPRGTYGTLLVKRLFRA